MITFLKKSVKFREKNGKILFQSKISQSTILAIISRPTPLLLSNVVVYGFFMDFRVYNLCEINIYFKGSIFAGASKSQIR